MIWLIATRFNRSSRCNRPAVTSLMHSMHFETATRRTTRRTAEEETANGQQGGDRHEAEQRHCQAQREVIRECTLRVHIGRLHRAKLQVGEHEYRRGNCQAQRELADDRCTPHFGNRREHSPLASRIDDTAGKRPDKIVAQGRDCASGCSRGLFDVDHPEYLPGCPGAVVQGMTVQGMTIRETAQFRLCLGSNTSSGICRFFARQSESELFKPLGGLDRIAQGPSTTDQRQNAPGE